MTPTDNEKSSEITPTNCKQSSLKRPSSEETPSNDNADTNSSSLNKMRRISTDCNKSPSKASSSSSSNNSDSNCTSPRSSQQKFSIPSDEQILITFDSNSSTPISQCRNFSNGTPKSKDYSNRSNSLIYLTPQDTPTNTDKVDRSRIKRSFTDFKDEHRSANSSFNSSAYLTPISSPEEKSSSVKKLKSQWNGSVTSCYTDSEYLNSSTASCESQDEGIQPELIGYQMLGDSQFCRFGQQLLGLRRVPMPGCPGRIGICVSGQTIPDLHRRVKEKFYPISDKVILMIGTNDFLRNADISTMCSELGALVRTLQETVTNLVLLTLPPIPKLEMKQNLHHFKLLDKYNNFIRSLQNGDKLRIADISPMYISSPPYKRCRMNLFEMYFNGPQRRQDMIHLNREGLEVIRKYILEHFYQ